MQASIMYNNENSNDAEAQLLNMFQTMGTEDHSNIVAQFQNIVGSDRERATFFLEANNWNLQTAIESYYESGNTESYIQQEQQNMALVADTTIPNKDCMMPRTTFRQSWRICNNGNGIWLPDTYLVQVSGDALEGSAPIQVPCLDVGEECEIAVNLHCPALPGQYTMAWKMCCKRNQVYFGEQVWVVINVVEVGAAVDEVEQRRLEIQNANNLDILENAFSNM